jgi:hypothetical protein
MPRQKQAKLSQASQPVLEPLLTMGDVQKILQLSKPKVYELMHHGLPSFKIEGARRFERVQLLAWLEQQKHVL